MPTIYCPTSDCGAAVDYTIVKPATCPKCGQAFAKVFRDTVVSAPVATAAPKTARPTRTTTKSALATRKVVPKRDAAPVEIKYMNPDAIPKDETEAAVDDGTVPGEETDDEFVDQPIDKEEIHQVAEQIRASLDLDTQVRVNFADTPERLFGVIPAHLRSNQPAPKSNS